MSNTNVGIIVQKYKVRQLGIFTDVKISPYINETTSHRARSYKALWDTGSDLTGITHKVVDQLGLRAIHELPLMTAGGERMSKIYAVNLILPNGLKKLIRAVECNMDDDIDVLIGMDVITQGDFAISFDEKENMYFSYRTPSGGAVIFS